MIQAEHMLTVWGERMRGLFGRVGPRGYGSGSPEEPWCDLEEAKAVYVETTEGFERAREVLVWVYVDQKRLQYFPYCGDGESLKAAAKRRGQAQQLALIARKIPMPADGSERERRKVSGLRRLALVELAYFGFVQNLERRLRQDPFEPPLEIDPDSPEQIAAEVSAKIDAKYLARQPRRVG